MQKTKTETISFASLPALGAELAGGIFRGVITLKSGQHAAVIQLPNKAQERMAWKDAMAWAKDAGGELPTRPISALLYATAKSDFEKDWYWTNEEYSASSAWYCYFRTGGQYGTHKLSGGRAVSVRTIHLVA